jgi:hypothetical protein
MPQKVPQNGFLKVNFDKFKFSQKLRHFRPTGLGPTMHTIVYGASEVVPAKKILIIFIKVSTLTSLRFKISLSRRMFSHYSNLGRESHIWKVALGT